jgi:hypothetical protein
MTPLRLYCLWKFLCENKDKAPAELQSYIRHFWGKRDAFDNRVEFMIWLKSINEISYGRVVGPAALYRDMEWNTLKYGPRF